MTTRRGFIAGTTGIGSGALLGSVITFRANPAPARESGGSPGKHVLASDSAVQWLLPKLKDDGSFGPGVVEMTSYHKSVYFFALAGETAAANAMMSYIKRRYLQPDGDFMLAPGQKRDKVAYNEECWGYSNGWFALAAHRMGRFDVSLPAYQYLLKHFHPGTGGFTSSRPGSQAHPVIDLISTAHMGMLALYLGDRERALAAGSRVQKFALDQPSPDNGIYVRMNAKGLFITDFPPDEAINYYLDRSTPGQFYFTPGYATAFLATLYTVTADRAYLHSAERLFELAASAEGVLTTHFSHKLAWGAALLYSITGDKRYADFALHVADIIVAMQSADGSWFADQPEYVSFDQTAECGIWLRAIDSELHARR